MDIPKCRKHEKLEKTWKFTFLHFAKMYYRTNRLLLLFNTFSWKTSKYQEYALFCHLQNCIIKPIVYWDFWGPGLHFFAKNQNFRKIAPPKTFQCRIYIRQMVGADFLGNFSKKCTFHEKVLTGAGKYLKYHYPYSTFSQGAKKLWKVAKSV